ncbi:hypothetical protein HK097_005568 [Rhizophlyctis rosea]|uniref:Serine/threonine-protein kinase PLK4 n=1 Tax=Rhizophlyctis rosea TaxID=64517 RepID=A0AAD5X2F7_9FUNG|nr:hypothetical protein HK097_005568 [Rhizophlyctis rosea]
MTRRVANEVEIHWQLHHPSILELLNYFEDDSYVYMVMELCKNGELYRYIQRRGRPLSEPEARGVATQLVQGMLYLHSNGIIHRDLKLSNLLLTDSFRLKIGDFGLAVKLNDPDGEQKTMCGTPNYISPEIVSRQPYGLMSDVWSLGCMLVTILTGKPPFESQAVRNTLERVSRVDYRLPDGLSNEAKDLIHRMLQKDPKKRIPLEKVLSHSFFHPSLPVEPLRPTTSTLSSQNRGRMSPHFPEHRSNNLSGAGTGAGQNAHQENVAPDQGSHARTPAYAALGRPIQTRHTTVPSTTPVVPVESPTGLQLPAFATTRLKPLQQKTKHGMVSILQTGEILLDFIDDDALMLISADSDKIDLFPKGSDPIRSSDLPTATYDRRSLPRNQHKKFRYASRFVDLVRSKTPKIVFYSPQAKCILMENGPLADFEMVFYSGIRVHYSVARNALEIKVPKSDSNQPTDFEVHRTNTSQPERIELPPTLTPVFKHVQECLRQCMDIERSGKLDANTRYPLILKSSRTQVISNLNIGHASPPPSFHPSTMSTYTTSAPATSTGAGGRSRRTVTSSDDGRNFGSDAGRSEAASWRAQSRHGQHELPNGSHMRQSHHPSSAASSVMAQRRGAGIRSAASDSSINVSHQQGSVSGGQRDCMRSASAPPPISATSSNGGGGTSVGSGSTTPFDLSCQFLSDVGWCVKSPDGRFVMLFKDGINVRVDAKDQSLEWTDAKVDDEPQR